MPRLAVAIALAGACLAPAPVAAQADADFELIRSWEPDPTVKATPVADRLVLESGTVRTGPVFADIVFRFEYRVPAPGAGGELLVRTRRDGNDTRYAYRIELSERATRGRLDGERQAFHEVRYAPPPAAAPVGEWIACEVRADRSTLTVSLDGAVVAVADRLDEFAGHLAFTTRQRGGIELRGMRVAAIPASTPTFAGEVVPVGSPGVTTPTIERQAGPIYPWSAYAARIQGVVLLEVIVDTNGLPADIRVVKSPHPDMSTNAVACVRKWRFKPGRRGAEPVAVRVTVEVAFNLKR